MREAMRGLAQGIVTSHEARAAGLGSIRRDVSADRERAQGRVQELKGTRRVTSRTLHSHLASGRAALARNEGPRKSGVRRWRTAFSAARTRHAAQVRATLTQSRAALEEAATRSREEAQASLKELASARETVAAHLRKDLARGHAGLKSSVSTQLQGMDRAHNAMAQQQRNDLVQGKADLARADAKKRAETLSWLDEITADRLAAGQEWRQMTTALYTRVAGATDPRAPAPMRPEDEAAALRDRVFAYLADHPDGVRFMEIEQHFKLNSQQASAVLRGLVEDGKAKRAGRLYLAT